MTQFNNEGYQGEDSPDRADALVWACTDLFPQMVSRPKIEANPVPIANPLRRR